MRRLILMMALVAGVPALGQELPPGRGHDEVVRRCMACHETDLITQQRLSTAGWGREVDKMSRWGAGVEAAERDVMIAYLARHFTPTPVVDRPASAAEGEGIYKRACLVCHEADLVQGQRLGRAGWTREVEKMIRWGAVVGDAEKSSLIDYLAGGPRP